MAARLRAVVCDVAVLVDVESVVSDRESRDVGGLDAQLVAARGLTQVDGARDGLTKVIEALHFASCVAHHLFNKNVVNSESNMNKTQSSQQMKDGRHRTYRPVLDHYSCQTQI